MRKSLFQGALFITPWLSGCHGLTRCHGVFRSTPEQEQLMVVWLSWMIKEEAYFER